MQKKIATGKIYLGGSFNREIDHERVERAKEILAKNPTIAKVHFPFDYDFVDPEEKNPEIGGQRSMTWRVGTFQNDLNGINSATCGVFLYDMDILDDGCAFEIVFKRGCKAFQLCPGAFVEHSGMLERIRVVEEPVYEECLPHTPSSIHDDHFGFTRLHHFVEQIPFVLSSNQFRFHIIRCYAVANIINSLF